MRLFIATDLPEQVLTSLSAMREQLSSDDAGVRWVPNESLHVTLKFLGDVPDTRVQTIDESLQRVRESRFVVEVAAVGFFPSERAPRVFWAGVRSTELTELANKVGNCMVDLGYQSGQRGFRPHLTLARTRGKAPFDGGFVDRARACQDREFGTFETDRFFLYQSQLEPSGAVYTKLGEYILGPDRPAVTIEP